MKAIINKQQKTFDGIKTMRQIRDAISLEITDMTYAEERTYLDKLLAEKSKEK